VIDGGARLSAVGSRLLRGRVICGSSFVVAESREPTAAREL
jgi:hypothetical protein